MPSKTTIQRYLKDSNVGVGFDTKYFQLFGEQMHLMKLKDLLGVHGILSFDEMQVRKALDVNIQNCSFIGLEDFGKDKVAEEPISFKKRKTENVESSIEITSDQKVQNLMDKQADHALVFMFSSLTTKFSQPVGFFASHGPTKSVQLAKLVITAISAIEKARGKIMVMVCDGAQTNRKVWTEFGIKGKVGEETKCFFTHPMDEKRKVYVISDVPRLFKCIRNNLCARKKFKVNIFIMNVIIQAVTNF